MQVSIERPAPDRLSFILVPDEIDAIPPILELALRHEDLHKVKPDRLALIAYLLTKPLIGNALTLLGAEIPAYMATAFQQDFGRNDLFLSEVTNRTSRIIEGEARVQSWSFAEENAPHIDGPIAISRAHYGYEIAGGGQVAYKRVYTNLRLYCALTGSHSSERERAILAVLVSNIYNGYQMEFGSHRLPETNNIMKLLSLIGIRRDGQQHEA